MSEDGGNAALLELQAMYLIDASDAEPEVTEWDDEASAQRKLACKVSDA